MEPSAPDAVTGNYHDKREGGQLRQSMRLKYDGHHTDVRVARPLATLHSMLGGDGGSPPALDENDCLVRALLMMLCLFRGGARTQRIARPFYLNVIDETRRIGLQGCMLAMRVAGSAVHALAVGMLVPHLSDAVVGMLREAFDLPSGLSKDQVVGAAVVMQLQCLRTQDGQPLADAPASAGHDSQASQPMDVETAAAPAPGAPGAHFEEIDLTEEESRFLVDDICPLLVSDEPSG